jgi:uncharacterized protein (DUF2062 family)
VRVPERFAVAIGFAIQVCVGGVCFLVVLLVAFGLAWVVSTVAPLVTAPTWLISGAQVGEEVIFGADVFVYGLLILSETLKFARTLWREWKDG